MARRWHSAAACCAFLGLGLAIGGHLDRVMTSSVAVPAPGSPVRSNIASGAAALIDSGLYISQLTAEAMPCAVHIQAVRRESDGGKVEETGSGVFARSRTRKGLFVITNNHVVRGAEPSTIELTTHDGLQLRTTRIFRDPETDIAVLQVNDVAAVTADWGNSDDVRIGNYVLAIGSPFGLSQSVTMGIVSAKGRRDLSLTDDRSVTNQDFIQTDAAINPGNSGGPLLDMEGRVVGINTAIASNSGGSEGIGFSIPSNLVTHVFEQLVSHGRVRRAYLGVELDNTFDMQTAIRLGLDRVRGAHVRRVYNGRVPTPAALAGIRQDDVILSFNGITVSDENHLINLVGTADIGQAVEIEIFRMGNRRQLELKLTDRDQYRTAAESSGSFQTR